jgi:NADPH:quinone reductase-like Zn-dependent oxidoreductase
VLDALAADVMSGRLRVPVQRSYSLTDAPRAMADFQAGTMGKLAISI